MITPSIEDVQNELGEAVETLAIATEALEIGSLRVVLFGAHYAIYHAKRAAVWSRGHNPTTLSALSNHFREEFAGTGFFDGQVAHTLNGSEEDHDQPDFDPMAFEATAMRARAALGEAQHVVQKIKEVIYRATASAGTHSHAA
jgi:uncharacterized protein (UPF0332 family)